uniref:peptidylprolyl isomerase n=1 Tax=Oryctolagus cuniculus TaxID=9986 RepID=A0A5F9D355_RABIT
MSVVPKLRKSGSTKNFRNTTEIKNLNKWRVNLQNPMVDHCPIRSRKGDVLHMHYTGKLEDGTEFDSSLPQKQPFVFSLGTGQVIKGWDQGLLGMCEGEKRKLVIPSELGYGERAHTCSLPIKLFFYISYKKEKELLKY